MNLRNLKIINGENIYNIEVTYSKIQGKQKLKQ